MSYPLGDVFLRNGLALPTARSSHSLSSNGSLTNSSNGRDTGSADAKTNAETLTSEYLPLLGAFDTMENAEFEDSLVVEEGASKEAGEPVVAAKMREGNVTVFLASLASVLLLVASIAGAAKIVSKKRAGLLLAPEHLKGYEGEFSDAVTKFYRTWESASPQARDGFCAKYFPRDRSLIPVSDPIPIIERHISDLRSVGRPPHTDNWEAKRDYALRLKLYTSVLEAAVIRVTAEEAIQETIEKYPAYNVSEHLLARRGAPETETSFGGFLHMLGDKKMYLSSNHGASGPERIPKQLAEKLACQVLLKDLENEADRQVHAAFSPFLNAIADTLSSKDQQSASFVMVPGDKQFPADIFRDTASRIKEIENRGRLHPRSVGFWADRWSTEDIMAVVGSMKERSIHTSVSREYLKRNVWYNWTVVNHQENFNIFSVAMSLL